MPSGSPELEESHSVLTYGDQDLEMQWERSETNNGIPYYVKHDTHETQWDHPEMYKVLHDLDEMNNIEYAAYRTAMKLRAVQKVCWLHVVKKHTLVEAWAQHGLGDDQNTTMMTPVECEAVLQTLFTLSKGDRPNDILNPNKATQITLAWLIGLVDSGRTGNINVQMAKIGLMTLCSAKLEEKYEYMLEMMAFPKKRISESQLRTLIKHTLLLPKQVFETASFNAEQTEPAIDSCYRSVGKKRGQAVSMQEFLVWMSLEPRFIVWLPTMHRLAASETVKHEGRCATCKAFPIVGLRFRCLKAFNTDLCQNCYLTKQLPKNVKPSHPFREYSIATSSGDDLKDFGKVLRNKVTKRYKGKQPKKSYLEHPVVADGQPVPSESQTATFDESFEIVESGQLGHPSQQQSRPVQGERESVMFENKHTRIGQLAGRLQELETQEEGSTARVVAAEIHTQSGEGPDMGRYQPAEGDTTTRNYPNKSYRSASPPAQTKPIPVPMPRSQRDRETSPSSHLGRSPEEQPHFEPQPRPVERQVYVEQPRPTVRREVYAQQPHPTARQVYTDRTPGSHAQFEQQRHVDQSADVHPQSDPRFAPLSHPHPEYAHPRSWSESIVEPPQKSGAIPTRQPLYTPTRETFGLPQQGQREFTDSSLRSPQQRSSYYTTVLPREDVNNAELRQILADLIAQKDALVQDLDNLKQSTSFLSAPVVVEKPSGLDPSFYQLQKDYMSTRLDTKEQHIKQLEHQLQALRDMIADKEKEDVKQQPSQPQQQEPVKSRPSPGKVSRGVNISTSFMSDMTEKSFFGNPEEDLAHIVQGMVNSFPPVLRKVQPVSLESDIHQAAVKVSQNFTSFSQELMGN
jgi:hypothetical protein